MPSPMAGSGVGIGAVIDGYGSAGQPMLELAGEVEKIGMDALWLPQMPNQLDVSALQLGMAMTTRSLTVGTAILPMYTRPPVVMAQAAMTADELSGGRTVLGLGLGHRGVGDWMVGGKAAPAVAATREYLTIVTSLLREGEVSFDGRWHSGHASYAAPRRDGLPVYLGAFGPRMLEVAGELADGAILWMCTPEYVAQHALPALRRGWARRGGRPATFRVVAMMHASATDEPDADRRLFGGLLRSYVRVATYRALFEASGFADAVAAGRPDDALIRALGAFGEEEISARMARYRRSGVDEIAIAPAGTAREDPDRCLDTLSVAHELARGMD